MKQLYSAVVTAAAAAKSTPRVLINPSTGAAFAHAYDATQKEVEDSVSAAKAAFNGPWSTWTGAQRRFEIK